MLIENRSLGSGPLYNCVFRCLTVFHDDKRTNSWFMQERNFYTVGMFVDMPGLTLKCSDA
jgi:hypothetical protein